MGPGTSCTCWWLLWPACHCHCCWIKKHVVTKCPMMWYCRIGIASLHLFVLVYPKFKFQTHTGETIGFAGIVCSLNQSLGLPYPKQKYGDVSKLVCHFVTLKGHIIFGGQKKALRVLRHTHISIVNGCGIVISYNQ